MMLLIWQLQLTPLWLRSLNPELKPLAVCCLAGADRLVIALCLSLSGRFSEILDFMIMLAD